MAASGGKPRGAWRTAAPSPRVWRGGSGTSRSLCAASDVFITALVVFRPVSQSRTIASSDFLGRIGKSLRVHAQRVLRQNGIRTRHYAIDTEQRTLFRNSELAAKAVHDALGRAGTSFDQVDYLAAATAQGDLLVPCFLSMVHGEAGRPSAQRCSTRLRSGATALSGAPSGQGGRSGARWCARASRRSRRSRRAATRRRARAVEDGTLPFTGLVPRWMLSDGARGGAAARASAEGQRPIAQGRVDSGRRTRTRTTSACTRACNRPATARAGLGRRAELRGGGGGRRDRPEQDILVLDRWCSSGWPCSGRSARPR